MIIQDIDLFTGVDRKVSDEIASISSEESYVRDTGLFERGEKCRKSVYSQRRES